MRITLTKPPFQDRPCYTAERSWIDSKQWPASWVTPPASWSKPWVAAFRCEFTIDTRTRDRLHVSADERYELYLDGERLGFGPERGDKVRWYYESYSVDLKPGKHRLVACVWALNPLEPWAQISIAAGFFCCPEKDELVTKFATGIAKWEALLLPGRSFRDMSVAAETGVGIGPSETFDARLVEWGWERGKGKGWVKGQVGEGGFHGKNIYSSRSLHWLCPTSLPPQTYQAWKRFHIINCESVSIPEKNWIRLLKKGVSITIPAHEKVRLLIDVEDFLCAYPEVRWSGGMGSRFSLGWAEVLRDPVTKEKRYGDMAADAFFVGPKDEVMVDGGEGRWWRPLWWRCGNYVQFEIAVGKEPLTLDGVILHETRYPFSIESKWKAPDPALGRLFKVCCRSLQMCMHETYMDSPYYEQLMYVGDTRLECLLTYTLSTDDRLPRKAIEMYDDSRCNPSGMVTAAYPNNGGQLIPPYALWWVAMVHDFARWRGQPEFVRERLPGLRSILDLFYKHMDRDGVLRGLNGWNFLDWTCEPGGVPAGGIPGGRNSALQAHWILVLGQMIELEAYAGDSELAARYRRWRQAAHQTLIKTFWNEKRGLLADDAEQNHYSEHAQCLALISGVLTDHQGVRVWKGLESSQDLVPVSCYFLHYYFEACVLARRIDLFFKHLAPWRKGVEMGARTTPEMFWPTRSECSAWSTHPLYHYFTGVLGIQPDGLGFKTVIISPQLGELSVASGTLAHPFGPISVNVQKSDNNLTAEIELPKGLNGFLRLCGKEKKLHDRWQSITMRLP